MKLNFWFFAIGIFILAITIGHMTAPPIGFLSCGVAFLFMALFSKYFD